VDAALRLEQPVGVLAASREGRGLQPRLLSRARLEQLGLEAPVLGPAQVHAEQDLGPVLRVGAARAGVDRDDRIAPVVLAGEERVLLEALELGAQGRERRGDLVSHVAVHRRELGGVLVLPAQTFVALEPPRHPGVFGRDLGRALLVVPEPRSAHLLLELAGAGR
jgi:hypothetical protein